MLQKIVNLIALVATIIKTDPNDFDEINAQVEKYNAAKAELKTFHGDHEMASAEVVAALDSAVAAARVAEPGDEDLIAEQDEAGEGSADETAEKLAVDNTREQLITLANREKVDIVGATTKAEIAERIVTARADH